LFRTPACRVRDRGIVGPAPIYIPPWCVSMLRILNGLEGFDVFLPRRGFSGSLPAALQRLLSRLIRSTGWMNIAIERFLSEDSTCARGQLLGR